jgi:hypothetical protein
MLALQPLIQFAELEVLTVVSFDLQATSVFDFVELYLAHFWNVMLKIGFPSDDLYDMCEMCVDLLYCNPEYFATDDVRLLACGIIGCASALTTGKPNRSLALLTWRKCNYFMLTSSMCYYAN